MYSLKNAKQKPQPNALEIHQLIIIQIQLAIEDVVLTLPIPFINSAPIM